MKRKRRWVESFFDINKRVFTSYGFKPKHDIVCWILTDIIIQITAYYIKRLFFQTCFVYRGVICGKDDTESTSLVLCYVKSKCKNTPAVDINSIPICILSALYSVAGLFNSLCTTYFWVSTWKATGLCLLISDHLYIICFTIHIRNSFKFLTVV